MMLRTVVNYFKLISNAEKLDQLFTTAWMPAAGKGVVPAYGTYHCKASDLQGVWNNVCNTSYCKEHGTPTLHVTINETNLTGRRTENIQSSRMLVLDLDREVPLGEIQGIRDEYKPSMIVESSPSKYHCYWLLQEGSVPLELWSKLQVGLAYIFNGDYNAANVTALIRVPGFKRICKTGDVFIPRIVYSVDYRDAKRFSYSELLSQWPMLETWIEKGMAERTELRREVSKLAQKIATGASVKDIGLIPTGGRNVTLYRYARERLYSLLNRGIEKEEITEQEIEELVLELNKEQEEPLTEREAIDIGRSAYRSGMRAWDRLCAKKREAAAALLEAGEIAASSEERVTSETASEKPGEVASEETKEYTTPAVPASTVEARGVVAAEETIHAAGGEDLEAGAPAAEPTSPGTLPIIVASGEFEEAQEESGGVAGGVTEGAAGGVRTKASKQLGDSEEVRYLEDTAYKFADAIWANDREAFARLLGASVGGRNYVRLSEYILGQWWRIGSIREECPTVFVKRPTSFGTEAWTIKKLCELQFVNILKIAIHKLSGLIFQDKELKKLLFKEKLLEERDFRNIGSAIWGAASVTRTQRRQEGNIIVFQNGVLELDKGIFTEDLEAPFKYSHPLVVSWDFNAEAIWREREAKGWSLINVAAAVAPVWHKYYQDWLPEDKGALQVMLAYFGYGMTTAFNEQKFLFLYGPGGAGKGSITQVFWHSRQ